MKEKIQPQVENAGVELDSFIVSNTSYLEVNWKDNLSIEEFNKNHVFFQKENVVNYITKNIALDFNTSYFIIFGRF